MVTTPANKTGPRIPPSAASFLNLILFIRHIRTIREIRVKNKRISQFLSIETYWGFSALTCFCGTILGANSHKMAKINPPRRKGAVEPIHWNNDP